MNLERDALTEQEEVQRGRGMKRSLEEECQNIRDRLQSAKVKLPSLFCAFRYGVFIQLSFSTKK